MDITERISALIQAADNYVKALMKGDEYETGQALSPLTQAFQEHLPHVIALYDAPGFEGREDEQSYWPGQLTRVLEAIERKDGFLASDALRFEMKANLELLYAELGGKQDAAGEGTEVSGQAGVPGGSGSSGMAGDSGSAGLIPAGGDAGEGGGYLQANLDVLRVHHRDVYEVVMACQEAGSGSNEPGSSGSDSTGLASSGSDSTGLGSSGSDSTGLGSAEPGSNDPGVSPGSEVIAGRRVLFAQAEEVFLLDSMYSSGELAGIWLEELGANYNSRVVMFGLGNGMFAARLLESLGEEGLLLVYEPDVQLLSYVLEYYDLRRIFSDRRLMLILPQTEDVEEDAEKDLYYLMAQNVDYTDIDGLRITSCPNYRRLYPESYTYFDEKTWEVVSSMRANRSVMTRFGELFVKNDLANYPYLAESLSIGGLPDPGEVSAIVVSSGPSLNKNIRELERVKGHAIIAAADSAVSVLLSAGIVPDIFFCVDAGKNPGHFTDPRVADIPLGTELDATSVVFSGRRGPCFFGYVKNPHVRAFLEDRGIALPKLKGGGSVAHTAVSFMLEIGIRNIVLVGQDLAYTGDKSHAAGSLRASWNMDLSQNECYIEGMNGEQVRSSHEFVTYRNWFERRIESRRDVNFINATEGGARIHGAREMTLREAVDRYCRTAFDAEAYLKSAGPIMDSDTRKAFGAYMDELPISVRELQEGIRTGIRTYDEMVRLVHEGKQGNERFKKLYQRTAQINDLLKESPCMYYVECMVQEAMTEVMERPQGLSGDGRRDLLDALKNGRDYLEIVQKGADMVFSCVNKG